jgi:hypothetical protein
MNPAVITPRMASASPRFSVSDFCASGFRRKIAGGLCLLPVLTAAFGEILFRGRLNVAGGLIAVSVMIVMMLPFYDILSPLNRKLSLLAASFNLVGLALEVLRLQPQGVNIAIVFNGFYCVLVGFLVLTSTFQPRILGVPMVLGGLGWLTFLSSPVAHYLSPYNLAVGLLGEGLVCLWLLLTCVRVRRRKERAAGAGAYIAAEAARLSRAAVISAQQ